jgi:hypothetical protein
MIEIAAKDVVFHFNKGHLTDPTIPMWVAKCRGKTYYINHMECDMPWSTKETPDNPSTKGSFKFKDCLLTIDDENSASLRALTDHDKSRLRNAAKGITRVITKWGSQLQDTLKNMQIKHGPIKTIGGACTTTFYVTDILDKAELTMLTLAMPVGFRELMPNESYYRRYDEAVTKNVDYYDEDEYYDEPDDSEE